MQFASNTSLAARKLSKLHCLTGNVYPAFKHLNPHLEHNINTAGSLQEKKKLYKKNWAVEAGSVLSHFLSQTAGIEEILQNE